MNINLLELYINNLTKKQANEYLISKNIILNNSEFDYLYMKIKNNYKDIINQDEIVLKDIKNNINKDSYDKLLDLFNKYKKYLN